MSNDFIHPIIIWSLSWWMLWGWWDRQMVYDPIGRDVVCLKSLWANNGFEGFTVPCLGYSIMSL